MGLLFLDTEFNGIGGELISLALFDERVLEGKPRSYNWYEVMAVPSQPTAFVAEKVIPALNGRTPIGMEAFLAYLRSFLERQNEPRIVADLSDDFYHLFACLRWDGGRHCPPFTTELLSSGPSVARPAHNALADAEALARWYLA